MRRIIVISLAGIALSGCSSFSSVPGLGFLTPSPPMVTLQLDSVPAGAEARTSTGPSCRTPCSVSVPVAPLTVTYTLDKYEPQTVAVQPPEQAVANADADGPTGSVPTLDPNPVFAELAPMAPQKRTKRPPPKRTARQAPAEAPPPPADAAPPPPAPTSPFPPAASSPFPSR
ncbi:hypothetical protein [Bradyrhizobium sp. LHD-71]|uniref:hypothetical protein n=1 Tax=Bradyrhizobium sp. LHD-71 TaxID=3072141 RepID=UPI00280E73A2|nr:hypothetical protein [Bradyrhizobium sp. LHD-71]MDQ8728635.1 hypothetical protein [Bradyrhizobium sp. LHD-71]